MQATETTSISSASGSGAAGLYAGVGAGATVVLFASAVQAAIDDGSIVNSSGNVALTATSNTAISATTVTAGAAVGLGIGAAAGVIIVGSAPPSDALSVLNQGGSGTLASVNSSANTAPSNGVEAGVPGTATTPKATSYDVTDEVTNGGSAITKASVDGSTITANSVSATAGAQMSTTNLVVGVGVGIGAGGAAVGYTRIDEAVTATIGGTINAATVSAIATMDNGSNGNAATVNAYAGSGGLGLALGAAVADARIDNVVTASVGGAITGSGANNLTISAEDSTVIATDALGATAGGGAALGVSLAFSQKSSQITAAILTSSNISGFTAIALTATDTGGVSASATAGAGGAGLAGDGVDAEATDEAKIAAEVGDPTLEPASDAITIALGSGGISLNASATPNASANAYGVAVSGVAALGASVANATAEPDVQAVIADGTVMTGFGGATLDALSAAPAGGTSASAQSFGATGGIVLAADATLATATGNATVNAAIGNNVTLPDGDVALSATSTTSQYAYADGVAAGGLLAAGASVATAQSTGNTTASLGYGVVTDAWRIGALAIGASGSDSNTASAVAGSGALLAGGASQATTSDTATTSATIADEAALTTIYAGDVTVASSHDAEFSSDANSVQASVVGFSGAFANDTVSSTVTSSIGQYVKIDSAGSITVTATNTTNAGGSSAVSGSGGVFVGSAVAVDTNITENAFVNIGSYSVLSVNGDPANSPGLIDLQASNYLNAGGTATMNAGGLAAGGDAKEDLTVNLTNNVTVGQNATLFSVGGIQIGTYSQDTLNNGSEAHLYGAITGAGAESSATINLSQTVDVGQNDTLEAYGLINVAAGESGDGSYGNTLVANSNTDVYNEALVPITGEARGTATINDNNTVNLEFGSQVLGVSNVTIGAYEGGESASGSGSSHNPYLSIFNATVHDDHSNTTPPSATRSALVVLDGSVTAGIHYQQLINIAADGTVSRGDASDNALLQVSGNVLGTYLTSDSNVLVYNVNNNDFPQQDVQAEINYLKSLPQTDAIQAELVNFGAQLLAVAPGPVSVITFGGVLASGGDVIIRADQLQTTTGASVLTANGAPTIDIENNSPAYLVLTAVTIPTNFGGHVTFTGAGTSQTIVYTGSAPPPATLITVKQGDTTDLPKIIINNNNPVSIPVTDLADAPANPSQIYLEGNVSNLNGSLSIFNKFGGMIQFGSLDAATYTLNLPNGSLFVNQVPPGTWPSNVTPSTQWSGVEIMPTDTTSAIYYIANALFNANGGLPAGGFGEAVLTTVISGLDACSNGTCSGTLFLGLSNQFNSGYGCNGGCVTGSQFEITAGGNDRVADIIYVEQLLKTASASQINSTPVVPHIVGGHIYVTAEYIDINGTLETGHLNDWSVNLGNNVALQILGINFGLAEGYLHGTLFPLNVAVVNSSTDTVISASYDAVNRDIVLNNVVNGSGGSVYLSGGIINTAPGTATNPLGGYGNIVVNSGYSNVTIDNTSGWPVVVKTINTGQSTPSVVQIVDTDKMQSNGLPLSMFYVYGVNGASVINVYQGTGSANTDYTKATLVGTINGNTTSYQPANMLYQWTQTANLSRSLDGHNSGEWDDYTVSNWVFSYPNSSDPTNPYSESINVVPNSAANPQTAYYQENITGSITNYRGENVHWHYTYGNNDEYDDQRVVLGAQLVLTNSIQANNQIGISFVSNLVGSINIQSNATVTLDGQISNSSGSTIVNTSAGQILQGLGALTNGQSISLIAPGGIGTAAAPVAVSLSGGQLAAASTSGGVNIAGLGSLVLSGISAPNGSVSLSATGDITAALAMNVAVPTITAQNITLASSGGAIGAITSVGSDGTTTLAAAPLVVQATPAILADGTTSGGVVSASGNTGVYLIQSTGDLRIGAVSSNGPVFLMAAATDGKAANIVNGVSATTQTAADDARLQGVWANLNLTTDNGQAAVTGYQNNVDRAYQEYWQLSTLDASAFGTTPSTSAVTLLEQRVAFLTNQTLAQVQTLEQAQPGYTKSYIETRMNGLKATLDTASTDPLGQSGTVQTAALTAGLQTFDPNFSYVLPTSSSVYTSLTAGAQWTLSQLTYSINRDADPANGGTPPTLAQLPVNVSGREVMLYAPSGSIGNTAAPLQVTFTTVDTSALTPAVEAALTAAGPGDLTVKTTALAGGVTQYDLSLTQQSLLVASAIGPIAAKAQSEIFLGGHADLLLGGVLSSLYPTLPNQYAPATNGVQTTSGGTVRIEAGGSILEGVPGQVAISGNISLLSLTAQAGSIGAAGTAGSDPSSNPNALILALNGTPTGVVDLADAEEGVYLRQTSGDLIVGNISAGASGAVQLAVTGSGSIYAESQFTDRTAPHILGQSLDVRADGGSIGFNGTSLQPLQVAITGGAVTGNASGAIEILSPQNDMTVGNTALGQYGVLTSGENLTINVAGGSLTVAAPIAGVAGISLQANDAVVFAAGTSAAPVTATSTAGQMLLSAASLNMGADAQISAAAGISIVTTGDAVLGQLITADDPAVAQTIVISVTAGGAGSAGGILSNGDGQINIVATAATTAVSLQAGGGIGSTSLLTSGTTATPLGVETPWLTVNADQMTTAPNTYALGNVSLTLTGTTHIATLSVPGGQATVLGNVGLTIDSLTAGTTVGVTSTGGALTLGGITSAGTQTIEGSGNVSFTTLTTTGTGDVDVTSDARSIIGGAISAAGGSTLKALATIAGDGGISGSTVTASAGAISMTGGGAISWTGALAAGTTIGVQSTHSAVSLATTSSPGTQTIEGNGNVTFTTLTTTGTGDVDVTSDKGNIIGGAIGAAGGATLNALATTAGNGGISGSTVTASAGAISMTAGGVITWTGALAAGTTIGVQVDQRHRFSWRPHRVPARRRLKATATSPSRP